MGTHNRHPAVSRWRRNGARLQRCPAAILCRLVIGSPQGGGSGFLGAEPCTGTSNSVEPEARHRLLLFSGLLRRLQCAVERCNASLVFRPNLQGCIVLEVPTSLE